MNKLYVVVLALLIGNMAFAQKYVPKVGVGTKINYNVMATAVGQQVPLTLTVISLNDPMKLKWDVPGLGTGSIMMSAKALESGTKMRLEEPAPNEDTQYKDDETLLVISKNALNDLIKNQAFEFNKIKFIAKPLAVPYKINDQEADVLYATTANGKIAVWILNNPDFPIICKFTGNPKGFDLDLANIKE
jgi:hypothetical protein